MGFTAEVAACLLIKMPILDTQKQFIGYLEIKFCSHAATRVILERIILLQERTKAEIFLLYQGVP